MSKQLSFMVIAHDDKRGQDWQRIEDFFVELNPISLAVRGRLDRAKRMAQLLPKSKVVYSVVRENETPPFWTEFPAEHYIEQIKSWNTKSHDNLIVDAFVENRGPDMRAFIDYNLKLGRYALDHHIPIALLGFATGAYERQQVLDGMFDDIIRLWCEHPDKIYLSFHEYPEFAAHFGKGTMSPDFVFEQYDPNQPNMGWGLDEKHQFKLGQYFRHHPSLWADPAIQGDQNHYMYRRCQVFHDRAESLGLTPGWIIITESNVAEQLDNANDLRKRLEAEIGLPMMPDGKHAFPTMKGPFTMQRVWEAWWGDISGQRWDGQPVQNWTWEDAYFAQLEYLDQIYQQANFNCLGVHKYVLEGVSDSIWGVWGFDEMWYPDLMKRFVKTFRNEILPTPSPSPILEEGSESPVVVKPEEKTKTVWITSRGDYANVRGEPRLSGIAMGHVTKHPWQVEFKDMRIKNDGYTWLEVFDGGLQKYVAEEVVYVHDSEPVAPAPTGDRINLIRFMFGDPDKTWQISPTGEILYWDYSNPHHPRLCKRAPWEGVFIKGRFFNRRIDVSMGNRFYVVSEADSPDGVRWIPTEMAVGETFTTDNQVQFYIKDTGKKSEANSGTLKITIELAEVIESLSINGLDCGRCVVLKGYWGDDYKNGLPPTETWTLSEIYGYFVRWEHKDGRTNEIIKSDVDPDLRFDPEERVAYNKHYQTKPAGAVNVIEARKLKPQPKPEPKPEPSGIDTPTKPVVTKPEPMDDISSDIDLVKINQILTTLLAMQADISKLIQDVEEMKKAS